MRISLRTILACAVMLAAAVPLLARAKPAITTSGYNGISEFYLRYTLENAGVLLQACTRDSSCAVGIEDSVQILKDSHLLEETRLQFLSSRELGSHLYRLDEGGVISINRDLVVIARNGVVNPYTYPDAISFLMRAWGERLRYDEAKIRMLSYRVSMLAYFKWSRVSAAEPFLAQFSFGYIEGPLAGLVLEDNGGGSTAYTLEIPFTSQLSCTTATGMPTPMRDLKITSAAWERATNLTFSHALIQVSGKLAYSCPASSSEVDFTSDYQVQVDVNFKQGIWSINPSSLRIQQNGIRATP